MWGGGDRKREREKVLKQVKNRERRMKRAYILNILEG